jgi:hypothetical protein
VPRDIALGDHTVKICWNNACRKETPLRVVYGVAEVPTTPVANATASPGQHTSPSPGSSPRPGSTPTARPTSGGGSTPQPTSPPAATPKPTPTPPPPSPTPNPCPTSSQPAVLIASPSTIVGGNTESLAGSNFTPNSQVTLRYYAGANLANTWTTTVSCSGGFSTSVATSGVLLGTRNDRVVACDAGSPVRCATAYFTARGLV